jgi:hypothetical protein
VPGFYVVEGDPELTAFQGYPAPDIENLGPPPPGEGRWLMPTELVLRWAAGRLGTGRP